MTKKNKIFTLILLIIFFIGIFLLFYPAVSQYWNSKVQTKAVTDYEKILSEFSEEETILKFKEISDYNEQLKNLNSPFTQYEKLSEKYFNTLNIGQDGMLGYINIPKINVEIPIYHTVNESVLRNGCGHMEGTSFPIDEKCTHTVLSAHRGLPNSTLFTHLDKIEEGDIFTISILSRTLTYTVDQIKVVEPNDVSDLQIKENENYCTLITCTPYGINTHRLLVRGKLIGNTSERALLLSSEAYRIDKTIIAGFVALPILFILIIYVIFKPVKRKIHPEKEDLKFEKTFN